MFKQYLKLIRNSLINDFKKEIEKDDHLDKHVHLSLRYTVLHIASFLGKIEFVEEILNHPRAIFILDKLNIKGETPLFFAAGAGHYMIVVKLLHARAQIDIQRNDGATALFISSAKGYSCIVDKLLQKGASPRKTNFNFVSPLFVAAQGGYVETVEKLAEADFTTIDFPNINGFTPLMIAVAKGHDCVVEILLLKKANPNLKRIYGITALHIATYKGYPNLVEKLLYNDANPRLKIRNQIDAVYVACVKKDMSTLIQLIKYGAVPLKSFQLNFLENELLSKDNKISDACKKIKKILDFFALEEREKIIQAFKSFVFYNKKNYYVLLQQRELTGSLKNKIKLFQPLRKSFGLFQGSCFPLKRKFKVYNEKGKHLPISPLLKNEKEMVSLKAHDALCKITNFSDFFSFFNQKSNPYQSPENKNLSKKPSPSSLENLNCYLSSSIPKKVKNIDSCIIKIDKSKLPVSSLGKLKHPDFHLKPL